MKAALEAVASGSSVNRAAVDHGVPPPTLKDRLAGQVQHGHKPGPKPYLDQHEEKELGDFCNSALQLGIIEFISSSLWFMLYIFTWRRWNTTVIVFNVNVIS